MNRINVSLFLLAFCFGCNQSSHETLEDQLKLKTLVDTFSNLADSKDVEKQLELFTDEAIVTSYRNGEKGSQFRGKEAIGRAFSGFLNLFDTVFHQNGQQVVNINGQNATGIAYATVVLIRSDNDQKIMTSYGIRYEDSYIKKGGHWYISNRKSNFLWEDTKTLE